MLEYWLISQGARNINSLGAHCLYGYLLVRHELLSLSLQVDRVSYLLQEIYGIENKNNQETKVSVKISPFRMNHNAVQIPAGCTCAGLDLTSSVSPAIRRREQRQQQRVCCLSVWPAGHAHPALQTSVSVQLLRRYSALPSQQLSNLQAA